MLSQLFCVYITINVMRINKSECKFLTTCVCDGIRELVNHV